MTLGSPGSPTCAPAAHHGGHGRADASDPPPPATTRDTADRHPLPVLRAPVRDGDAADRPAVTPPAPSPRSLGHGRRPPVPHQPRRPVPEGLDERERARPADRLTHPAGARRDGDLQPADWDEALDVVATRIAAPSRWSGGPDTVAIFGGGGLTNEKAYALGKFARIVLRTPFIDYNGRFCMSAPRPAPTGRSASTVAPLPAHRSRRRAGDPPAGQSTSPRRCRRPCSTSLGRARGGRADRRRPPPQRRRP